MAKKVWAKRSYETANLIVTFGFYMGVLPVKWNKAENKMEPVTSRLDIARWVCCILFFGASQIAILINFGKNILTAEDKIEFFFRDPFRIGVVAISAISISIHLHTAWKYKEFVSFINRAANFYEYFQSKLNVLVIYNCMPCYHLLYNLVTTNY